MLVQPAKEDIVFQEDPQTKDILQPTQFNQFTKKHIITTKTITYQQSQSGLVQIPLNQSGTSYLTLQKIPSNLRELAVSNFKEMWQLHPQLKHKIILGERQILVHRYSKSYMNTPTNLDHVAQGRSYMYSGYDTSSNREELPGIFQPFYQQMKGKDQNFNQVIANWYEKMEDYIAFHSDCEKGMIENAKVAILSLYPCDEEQNFRFLELIPKKLQTKSLFDKYLIRLDHGLIVTMHGTCQKEFRHGIRKEKRVVSQRLSLSFRQMKKQLYDECK